MELVALVNADRVGRGLPAFSWHELLWAAANGHSKEMAANGVMRHQGDDGSNAGDRITAAGFVWSAWGENLGAGYTDPGQLLTGVVEQRRATARSCSETPRTSASRSSASSDWHSVLDDGRRQLTTRTRFTTTGRPTASDRDTPSVLSLSMSRDRAPYVAQGTWRSGALHVWGWNGESPASAAWLYAGFGSSRWSDHGEPGWHDSPISYGELGRIQLELPDGGQRSVPAVRLDPYGAAVWLSDTPSGNQLSPSLAWFAALTGFAMRLVGAGRVAPEVLDEGPFTVARWRPVLDTDHLDAVAHAAASAPAICRNGTRATTEEILARPRRRPGAGRPAPRQLAPRARPTSGRSRYRRCGRCSPPSPNPTPSIRSGSDDFHDALDDLTRTLDRHRRRLAGEPVVRGRVRLTLPDDALDPWLVELELVDDADPGRWCTADDVWTQSPRALDLAGSAPQLASLEDEIEVTRGSDRPPGAGPGRVGR